jgi:hypothetical protein
MVLLCLAPALLAAQPAEELDHSLAQQLADYTGLYTKDTLPRWKQLFLPTFTSASTNQDGSVEVRGLEAFYASQAQGFADSSSMGERLENVRVERLGPMASIRADFVFWADGPPSRGRLMLLAIHGQDGWRFHSLMFSYQD